MVSASSLRLPAGQAPDRELCVPLTGLWPTLATVQCRCVDGGSSSLSSSQRKSRESEVVSTPLERVDAPGLEWKLRAALAKAGCAQRCAVWTREVRGRRIGREAMEEWEERGTARRAAPTRKDRRGVAIVATGSKNRPRRGEGISGADPEPSRLSSTSGSPA